MKAVLAALDASDLQRLDALEAALAAVLAREADDLALAGLLCVLAWRLKAAPAPVQATVLDWLQYTVTPVPDAPSLTVVRH